MPKIVGYMLTWTTYGTWLQGDDRGYVQNGEIKQFNKKLKTANKKLQKSKSVRLTENQKRIAKNAIIKESERIGQKVFAVAVCSNHVHMVVGAGYETIENSASRYKNVTTCALKQTGLSQKVWTRGFNKKFCFTPEQLKTRINYVQRHK